MVFEKTASFIKNQMSFETKLFAFISKIPVAHNVNDIFLSIYSVQLTNPKMYAEITRFVDGRYIIHQPGTSNTTSPARKSIYLNAANS